MAEKYLIKRACYLIKNGGDGGYVLHATSTHWKEGMELFESYEECSKEIERRIAERMSSGKCDRCHYKPAIETDRDISQLESLGEFKFGSAFRCQSCNTVWYRQHGAKISTAYLPPLLDYLIDWSKRNLSIKQEWKPVLREIKNISDSNDNELYPAHVILKNGEEIQCALISLERKPPPADWFNSSGWYYLDQVKEIKPSKYAYAYAIAKHIIYTGENKPGDWIYIKDKADNKLYGFNVHAGVFMPDEFIGKEFQLIEPKDLRKNFYAIPVFQPEERGTGVIWNFTQPPKTIAIWGDFTD